MLISTTHSCSSLSLQLCGHVSSTSGGPSRTIFFCDQVKNQKDDRHRTGHGTPGTMHSALNESACAGGVPPSCSTISCTYSFGEVQEPQYFWKRHKPHAGYPRLFSPPLGQGSNGYSSWRGRYNFSLPRLSSKAEPEPPLVAAINLLFHDPIDDTLCGRMQPLCHLGNSGDGGWVVCSGRQKLAASPQAR